MESRKREKWTTLTGDQRSLLLAIIQIFKGQYVPFNEFAETMHSLLGDFPGMEILADAKRATFVEELWRQYEWRKRKLQRRQRSLNRGSW